MKAETGALAFPSGSAASEQVDPRELTVLRLSAVMMAVWGSDHPGVQGVLMALCAAMLAFPRLLTSPWPWLAGASALGAWISVVSWSIASQHKIFVFDWVLACGIARFAPNPGLALAVAGRWMLAILFGLATFWKIAGGEYFDGGFMEFLLLWREELGPLLVRFGQMEAADVQANYETIAQLRSTDITGAWAAIHASGRVDSWGDVLSWGTILAEAAMTLAFVLPLSKAWLPARDLLILAFVMTVDVAFPYTGFAYPMLMAGLAQAPAKRWVMPAYVGVLAAHTLLVFLIHGQPLGRSTLY